MNKLKRAITVCLSVLISASLFTPFSAASDENGYPLVYEDIGSELLLSVSDAFLDGFNSADAGWRVTGGDCMIEGGDSTLCPPYEGDGSLTVYSDDYDKDKGIVIKKPLTPIFSAVIISISPSRYFSPRTRSVILLSGWSARTKPRPTKKPLRAEAIGQYSSTSVTALKEG